MPVTIKATEKPLYKIFSDDFDFGIPPYQRPYAWTPEQCSELLTDLLGSLGNGSEVDKLDPYFLGSVVLIKQQDSPESDVVDGQQRLITLTILMSVFRNFVPSQFATELTAYIYEKGKVVLKTPNHYRLKLREQDAIFFQKYIQDENGLDGLSILDRKPLPDNQKNIKDNAKYFADKIAELPEPQRIRLLEYLMKRCFLVIVTTPDLDSAYRIFTVLNTRGLSLETSDILKPEIIGPIDKEYQESYTKKWEDVERTLGRDNFQELFTHIRMIYRKVKLRGTLAKEFRIYIEPQKEPKKFIDDVLNPYSKSLLEIKTGTYESDKDEKTVNSLLGWLNRIDNFDWRPPSILYLTQNREFCDKLIRFFTDLERLASGLMILRADVNCRIERYGRLLKDIENKADLYANDSPLQLTPKESIEIIEMLDGNLYLMPKIRLYVLLRLDSTLAEGEATFNYPIISVEHVLPQNPIIDPPSEWLTWFPVKEERDKYTHRIGNLVLLSRSKNSQAQNFEFDVKKNTYFTSRNKVCSFPLTTQVIKELEWTPDVINRRQGELLQKLKELWRLR